MIIKINKYILSINKCFRKVIINIWDIFDNYLNLKIFTIKYIYLYIYLVIKVSLER